MQVQPPSPMRLHWIPVEPSWLVAVAIIVLAALPHQIPLVFRKGLRTWIGGSAFAAVIAWVGMKVPVLGMAMALMMASVLLSSVGSEPFVAPVLNVNRVASKKRWFSEEVLSEDPHAIQERTESPSFLLDKVGEDEKHVWLDEDILDLHPEAIQERPVSTGYDDDDGHANFGGHT